MLREESKVWDSVNDTLMCDICLKKLEDAQEMIIVRNGCGIYLGVVITGVMGSRLCAYVCVCMYVCMCIF